VSFFKMNYPIAPRSSVVDDFISSKHGPVKVPNPYNWLEDSTSPQTQAFVEAQNSQFQTFIQDPELETARHVLQKTLRNLHSLPSLASVPQSSGDYYYYRIAGQGAIFPITYRVKKCMLSEMQIGVSFADLVEKFGLLELSEKFHDEAEDGGALVSSGFSKSGRYWAYSSSIKGSAWTNIRIKDTTTRRPLKDFLRDTKFAAKEIAIEWISDLGFFYQFWPEKGQGLGPQLRFHRVGSEQKDDVVVFEDRENLDHTFTAGVSEDEEFVLLSIFKGGRNNRLQATKITPGSEILSSSSDVKLDFDIKISDTFDAEWRYVSLEVQNTEFS
jgi:prolyl oligopeptidase